MSYKKIILFLLGCMSIPVYATKSNKRLPDNITHLLKRNDKSLCHYYFDMLHTRARGKFSILLLLQGSETKSAFRFTGSADTTWLKKANVAVLVIEKRGITRNDINKEQYLRYNSLDQRTQDCAMVVDHIRKTTKKWNGKLLVCGGSEGAALAAFITPLIPEIVGTIMLSGGCGMSLREEIILLVERDASPGFIGACKKYATTSYIKLMLLMTRLFPNSSYTCIGETNSFKYWSSIADYNPLHTLLKVSTPLYLAHGTSDTNCPVESARVLVQHFKDAGKTNLQYKIYEGLNHSFTDSHGENHLDNVLNTALKWAEPLL